MKWPFLGKHRPKEPGADNSKEKIETRNTKSSNKTKDCLPIQTKPTTSQRARQVALALVLWVLVPLLLLSLIFLTIWTHDPKLEDCQEDTPLNCPIVCPKPRPLKIGQKLQERPALRNQSSPALLLALPDGCWRDQAEYMVPFLSISLCWPEVFLVIYMVFLIKIWLLKYWPEHQILWVSV